MSKFTPDTTDLRVAWSEFLKNDTDFDAGFPAGMSTGDVEEAADKGFDTWLSGVRAAAWEDGALAAGIPIDQDTLDQNNPHRRQA